MIRIIVKTGFPYKTGDIVRLKITSVEQKTTGRWTIKCDDLTKNNKVVQND